MKKSIMILMMVATGFFCSAQSSKSTQDSAYTGNSDSVRNVQSQKQLTNHNEKNVDTKYEYTWSNGARVLIQNSFPKSGINYTDPNGKKYVYAVFWTQIINETSDPLELTIDFRLDSFEIPSSSGNYMKLLLPSDTMTIDKAPLYDYGLTIKSFLDNNLHNSSSLKRTIHPKDSSAFYVVALSDRGVGGTIRTGFSLKDYTLFYRINDKEIHCGKIILNHNVVHEFTYLVAMRDFCDKTLSQMRANSEVNKKLSKELKMELSNAKAELSSAKFNGLKIESDYYEMFLKQINDRFKD